MVANPKVRVMVDWDDDGVWLEADEDITSDVARLRLDRRINQETSYAEPARLTLDLHNAGHKYSPPNSGSPLTGNLLAGRKVWVQCAYPFDDFNAPDGDIAGRALPTDSNFTWLDETTEDKGFSINSNEVQAGLTADPIVYTVETHDADAYIGVKFRRDTNALGGIALRVVDENDYLVVRFGDTSTVLQKWLNKAFDSTIRSGDAIPTATNYFIEVEIHGPNIRVFATDLDAGAEVRKEIIDGGGTAGNQSATKHGLWNNASAFGEDGDRWDDFGGWRSIFHGVVDSIRPAPHHDTARLAATDHLEPLDRQRIHRLAKGLSQRPDAIIDSILTWAGFPVNDRELDTTGQVLGSDLDSHPKPVWTRPLRALRAAQDEEDGLLYQDGIGYIRLEASGHRDSGSHSTSRATIDDDQTNAPYFSELDWQDGGDLVQNAIEVAFDNPPDQGLNVIWTLRDIPLIPAGETRTFLAISRAYEVVDSIRSPVATTDYTANSAEDGSGTDLTSDQAVSIDTTNFEGRGTLVTVTNNHSTTDAYLTLMQLRADFAGDSQEETTYQATAGDADQEHRITAMFIDNHDAQRNAADRRLARKKDPKPLATVTIPAGGHYRNMLQALHREISDRLTLAYADMGVSQDFWLEGLELVIQPGGMTATWTLKGV